MTTPWRTVDACRKQKELLEAQSEVTEAAIGAVGAMGKLVEAKTGVAEAIAKEKIAEARRSKAETLAAAMASLRASPFFQIEYLAKCKSQADCQRATERLQGELDVSKAMLACDEAMNKMIEVSTRCEILRVDEIRAQEARARA